MRYGHDDDDDDDDGHHHDDGPHGDFHPTVPRHEDTWGAEALRTQPSDAPGAAGCHHSRSRTLRAVPTTPRHRYKRV